MQLDFVQQGGGLYFSVEATVCVRYTREYLSRVFLVLRAPQSDRFSEVKCMGKSFCVRRTGGSSRVSPHYIE